MRFVEAFRKVDDVLFQAVRGSPNWSRSPATSISISPT